MLVDSSSAGVALRGEKVNSAKHTNEGIHPDFETQDRHHQ